jgi:hypothetical protein
VAKRKKSIAVPESFPDFKRREREIKKGRGKDWGRKGIGSST